MSEAEQLTLTAVRGHLEAMRTSPASMGTGDIEHLIAAANLLDTLLPSRTKEENEDG